jgi:hypothetical protein
MLNFFEIVLYIQKVDCLKLFRFCVRQTEKEMNVAKLNFISRKEVK